VLEIHGLKVNYGKVEAVRGVELSADKGRITLVLGANGAGKTTSLKAISGLVPRLEGRVSIDGTDLTGMAAHKIVRHGIVLVPEGRKVFGRLTVFENLRMGAYTANKSGFHSSVERVYDMFPILKERRSGLAGLLSGGEQQMLAFGRALMSEPKYMLMDEPSMGLAPTVVEQVMEKVRFMAESGIGILMVEQNAGWLEVADDVVAVARGEVVFSGSAESARSHASVLRAFLGEAALADDSASA
jgi:branched-chain amino acid transport system ATP-binding protein